MARPGYKIKDRSAKVAKRRNAMPVTGNSVFVVQSVIQAKAEEARRNREALAARKERR